VAVAGDLEGMVRAADFHLELGRYEDAEDLATRALEIRFDARARRILGLVLLHRGDREKAVASLARAERTPAVREGLIRVRLALGQFREAVKEAEAARGVADSTAGLRRACALVARLQQRRAALAKEVQVPTDRAEAVARALDALVCAEEAHDAGRPADQVEKLLAGVFAGGVEVGPAYSLRGLLALEKGRLAKALADAERALALTKQDARAFYVQGRVRFERGTEGALADLTRAAELTQRKEPAVLQALAAALWQAGRRSEALAAQREAVKLRPKDTELRDQLREMERQAK
jgi:tetratricopeptide (TPR) repeat protein